MSRPRPLLALLAAVAAVCLLTIGSPAQDTKKDDKPTPPPAPRLKGQLPQNYRLLGLTEEQKQAVYKIQGEYDVKLAALEEQIKKLKVEERQAIDKVLTDAQRARLKEIIKEKIGADTGTEKPASPGKP